MSDAREEAILLVVEIVHALDQDIQGKASCLVEDALRAERERALKEAMEMFIRDPIAAAQSIRALIDEEGKDG